MKQPDFYFESDVVTPYVVEVKTLARAKRSRWWKADLEQLHMFDDEIVLNADRSRRLKPSEFEQLVIALEGEMASAPPLQTNAKVRPAPGTRAFSFLAFAFSRGSVRDVFEPALNDMRFEYYEALKEGAMWQARWIHARGLGSLAIAAASLVVVRLLQPLSAVANLIRGA